MIVKVFFRERPFCISIFGLCAFVFILSWVLISRSQEEPRGFSKSKVPESPIAPAPRILAGKIEKGQTLSSALRSVGVSEGIAESISRQLAPYVNLRQIQPGEAFEIRTTPEGKFLQFTYRTRSPDIYQITQTPSGQWVTEKKEIQIDKYWSKVSGEIASSLFEAMDALGERDSLVFDFVDIFSWEIDFHSDPQKGDRFELLVEKYFLGEKFLRYGRILFAAYHGANRKREAFYYEPPGEAGGYYDQRGESMRKALLRSPLKFTRISSGYSRSRLHPIFRERRPHLGIDYAAPEGTPVVAIGDGIVTACGVHGGFGKQVVLRHANGYESSYGHLSRFAPGIQRGKRVRQKEIIGFVGSTGSSTGPHLDFRLRQHLTFVNPLRVVQPPSAPLKAEQREAFQEAIRPVLSFIENSPGPPLQKIASLSSGDLGKPGR